jgi:hypothetical protein
VKPWVPGTVVAMLLAGAIGAAGYYTLGRGIGSSPSPTPTVDPHSKEAVIAAIKHYYTVIDQARSTGNAALIDTVSQTGTPSNNNLKQFLQEQAARNRRGVATAEYFGSWSVEIVGDRGRVQYTNWSTGHDIDATTSKAVEADMTTSKGRYAASLVFVSGRWLVTDATLVQDNVP